MSAPGDGLPTVELFFTRILFRLFSYGSADGKIRVKFKKETDLIKRIISEVDDSILHKPITIPRVMGIEDVSKHWSIAMTMHHLNIVNRAISTLIDQLEKGHTPSLIVRIQDVKPPLEISPNIREEFEQTSSAYLEEVKKFNRLGVKSRLTHPHPWFGAMNSHDWLALSALHQGVHRRQIAMILACSKIKN